MLELEAQNNNPICEDILELLKLSQGLLFIPNVYCVITEDL